MSSSSTGVADLIAKLPPTIQNLVQNASSKLPGSTAFGSSEKEWGEISDWLRLASRMSEDELEVSFGGPCGPMKFVDSVTK
jgi:hypothetical protein